MIFPIGDTQVKGGHKPIVSYTFIAINILIFLLQWTTPGNLICEYSVIPTDIILGTSYHTLITSMFMHGSWMHLIGNMLFLWVFADNIEAKIGSVKFLLYYLAGGLFATFTHIYFTTLGINASDIMCYPCLQNQDCSTNNEYLSATIPSLGASGAISAIMGTYLLMFPKSQIKVLVIIFFRSFYVPAFLFLGLWFIQQLFSGVGTLSLETASGAGVAWWAHIGGFVFGLGFGLYALFYLLKNIGKNQDNIKENQEWV